jgi:hypothetical protein
MTEELCYKYLVFIVTEVERYLQDNKVTDDELTQFSIEIGNFKEKVLSSNIDSELKKRVSELDFKYTQKQIERSGWMKLFMIITFGSIARLYYNKKDDRNSNLANLKSQANTLMLFMKMNY